MVGVAGGSPKTRLDWPWQGYGQEELSGGHEVVRWWEAGGGRGSPGCPDPSNNAGAGMTPN